MADTSIYRDIAERTHGDVYVGVVGPVRTGKSSFIQRFMEKLVIPRIENSYMRQRAWDELPQSGSGRSIMTAEPKFVPEEPVSIALGENSALSVRLVDCVGYMVEGAAGQMEDGRERMVTTPWFDHEVTMSQAAEQGTELVIRQHADIGIVVTCDGSICELPREAYREPEGRVIRELQEIGKPFVVILNSSDPEGEEAQRAAEEIRQEYGVGCLPVNCLSLEEAQIVELLRLALHCAFVLLGAERVTLGVFTDNLRAYRCYAAVGFRDDPLCPERTIETDGRTWTLRDMALPREEYRESAL